ncbi:MAG: tRNA (guanosine(37)-N1)-methyltransferase TrmD [Lachnospiraceae bacterium]|nr:tRNA (guanosine(37)-N1)-methyltransferase TrmD [Lachnospiraceae bacterium]
MNFHILSLFPEMVEEGLNTSILKRASDAGIITINAVDIRDYSLDKHKKVDDYPYGGGAGMLMQAQPIFDAYNDVVSKNGISKKARVILMTPQGRTFDQRIVEELSKEEDLIFLCGHYEGIDERVIEEIVTDEISLGEFVLTGGELAAMVMIDCISRLIPGVLGSEESASDESFSDGLLEYPQYTRPEEWQEKSVPPVLLSGNHKEIEKWRVEKALERTKERRPDMYEKMLERLNECKGKYPRKFRKKRSLSEEIIRMREIENDERKEI